MRVTSASSFTTAASTFLKAGRAFFAAAVSFAISPSTFAHLSSESARSFFVSFSSRSCPAPKR